jgi:hypothetical protein
MAKDSGSRGKRDDLYSLDDVFVKVHRSPAGTAWRWRTELLTLASLLAAYCWLWSQLTRIWAAVVLAAFLGLVFGLPWTRRFTMARFWCVLARHRFQRLCWEARLHTRAGRLPVILWTRPTKVGERLHVWCRAGISAEDFAKHTDNLRAACYARDARVTRNPQWSQLVTLDIIRRDTLAASHSVGSPLSRLTTTYADWLGVTSPAPEDGSPSPQDSAPAWPDTPGLDGNQAA